MKLCAIALCLGFLSGCNEAPENASVKVVVTQIVDHPSLNQEYQGLLEGLSDAGWIQGENITIQREVAQGSIAMAAQIASKFASVSPDVVVALSTPSTQACMAALNNKGLLAYKDEQKQASFKQKSIPLVFSAVSDVKSPRIVLNEDSMPRRYNLTGVTDYLPAKLQLEFVKRLNPSIQNLGVIYNAGEANSNFMVHELKAEAKKYDITIVEAVASSTSDVAGAVQKLVANIDMLLVPNDNTAVSAIEGIVHVCHSAGVPVLAVDLGSLESGVTAAMGYDRIKLGRKIADHVDRILKGESAAHLPILGEHEVSYFVREIAAKKLGINYAHIPNIKTYGDV